MQRSQAPIYQKGSLAYLGQMAHDFGQFVFDDEDLTQDELAFVLGRPTSTQFLKQANDLLPHEVDPHRNYNSDAAILRSRENYWEILAETAHFLQSLNQALPKSEEGLGFETQRSMNALKEWLIALCAFDTYYRRGRHPDYTATESNLIHSVEGAAQKLVSKGFLDQGARGKTTFAYMLQTQAAASADKQSELIKQAPVVANGHEVIEEVSACLQSLQNSGVLSSEAGRKAGILENVLSTVANSFDEFEIQKNFSSARLR